MIEYRYERMRDLARILLLSTISTAQVNNHERRTTLELADEPLLCESQKHVLFHKKHKSASSTMAALLKDWSRNHKLTMAKTPVAAFIGGYPAPFDPKLVRGLPPSGKFDIILHHLRFHKENLGEVLHDDTIYLTSMRNPLSHFVSTFEFFYGRFTTIDKMASKSNKGQSLTCWGHPFVDFLGGAGRTPNDFINRATEIYNPSAPWHFRARNFQSYELGFDSEIEDLPSLERIWEAVNNQFHLVMITEHYWESLILMKDLLCMNWFDLYIDSRTVGSYEKPTFTDKEVEKFKAFNGLDEYLYQMSNATFWEKADARTGGINQLKMDVEKLKTVYKYCDANQEKCMKLKSNYSGPKSEESQEEIKTFDDNYDKYNYLFDNMKKFHGDCPYGFYEKFHSLPEAFQRQMTDVM